jgi:plastocyanin
MDRQVALTRARFTSSWAQSKVTVSREESKPQKVEVKVGEEVRWVNGSGGTAHVEFSGAPGINFHIGKEGRVKFDKPGTYDYVVHISGVKGQAHTGTVVVKWRSRTRAAKRRAALIRGARRPAVALPHQHPGRRPKGRTGNLR